jgi:GTP pyrophosphokinase
MSELGNLRDTLRAWIEAYIASAGPSAQVCLEVYEGLLEGRLNARAPLREALPLLEVLAGLSPDPRTVCCALLFVAQRHGENIDDWKGRLPAGVPAQLASLLQLHQVKAENFPEGAHRSAEGLRRLLLALVKDVRVVLIALAWQLVQLRAAKDAPAAAQELARETLLIHAPLANRLGVWQLKWELEDLAFRFQDPDAYKRVAKQVAERRADRETFIRPSGCRRPPTSTSTPASSTPTTWRRCAGAWATAR